MKPSIKLNWRRFVKAATYSKHIEKKKWILILLTISIPSLLIGLMMYVFGIAHLKAELIENHEEQIENQVEYMDAQIRSLEVNLNYLSHERPFRRSLADVNFQEDFEMTEQLSSTLFSMQNSNTLIEQVHLFINSDRPSVFNPQFHWTNEQITSEYQRYLGNEESFFWERNFIQAEEDTHKFPLVLVRNLSSYQTFNDHASVSFVVELNQEAMLQMIDGLSMNSEGTAFLIDEKTGMIVSSNHNRSRFLIENLLNEEHAEPSFTTSWDGQSYSISSGSINRVNTDWTYMSVVPISYITAPIERLSQILILTSIIGMVISYIIGNFALKSVYQPFSKFMDAIKTEGDDSENTIDSLNRNWKAINQEKEFLEVEVEQLNQKLIEHFMTQLVRGQLTSYSEENLRERAEKYHIDVLNKHYYFMDIELTGKKKKGLLQKKMEECIESIYYPIQFNDRFMGIVWIVENEDELKPQVEELYQSISADAGMDKVVMLLSHSVEQLSDIYQAVEQVYQRKYKGNSYEHTVLIWLSDLEEGQKKHIPLDYPFSIESDMIQAIDFLNFDRVVQLLDQFILLLVEQDERSIQYGFIQLYSGIQSQILRDGLSPYKVFEGRNIMKEIMHNYNVMDLKQLLIERVIQPYITAKKSEDLTTQEYIVKEAVRYIQANYMYDLSLEECAEELEVNTYNLSRWFKHAVKENFSEYVTHYRMEKAKRLLADTDKKIGEIAESVGYQNSYFNRSFKKLFSMTPGQYRKQHQKPDQLETRFKS